MSWLSPEEFEVLVEEALVSLPRRFLALVEEVPHMLHRKGRSADISFRAWYSEKKQDWAPNKDVLDAVKKACDQGPVEVRDASGNVVRVIEFKCVPEGDHFHVELLPKDPPSPSNPPCPPRFLSSFCPFKAFPNGAKCN
ncbi:MAG: hypothetical protein ACP5NF_08075 [Thermoanaerobaculum sp.]